ncbi:hypothetical protein TNCV_1120361 [Trichonephila clavipes]|uniref:Uncharacterized protein n=1 Tax=Trichonephila clavipes TaxID=2585209 RepID=A0A8X6T3U3_TRICX|nr:hypothetical protein TNCV_1120361 [Trichonephila clavipes]
MLYNHIAVYFVHHENPPILASFEPGTLGHGIPYALENSWHAADIGTVRSSTEATGVSLTKKNSLKNSSHVACSSHLRGSCGVERSWYNRQAACPLQPASLYTLSRSTVPRLNPMTSGNGSEIQTSSRIGIHETFRSAPSTARNLP